MERRSKKMSPKININFCLSPFAAANAEASLGQKEAKGPNPLWANIKVTIPNGICKVYDIIPPPFSLIEGFIKILRSWSFQKKSSRGYLEKYEIVSEEKGRRILFPSLSL